MADHGLLEFEQTDDGTFPASPLALVPNLPIRCPVRDMREILTDKHKLRRTIQYNYAMGQIATLTEFLASPAGRHIVACWITHVSMPIETTANPQQHRYAAQPYGAKKSAAPPATPFHIFVADSFSTAVVRIDSPEIFRRAFQLLFFHFFILF